MVSMLYVLYRFSKYLHHISHPLKSISFNSIVKEREREIETLFHSVNPREEEGKTILEIQKNGFIIQTN